MAFFQKFIQIGRKVAPRGWSPVLRGISHLYPPARMYPALLKNGDHLFVDLSQNMCHRYFYDGECTNEEYTTAFFEEVLAPGDVLVDIGANIGYFARIGAKLVGEQGTVHAFEPMPEALRVLKENIKGIPNIQLHEVALSAEQGTGEFSVNKHGDTSSLGRHPGALRTIRVSIDTLNNVLQTANRIDVIKIDVEGYELEVLRGAKKVLARHKPLLYFEFIPDYTTKRLISIDDFRALLEPLDYTLSWMNPEYPAGNMTSDTPSWYVIGIPAGSRWSVLA